MAIATINLPEHWEDWTNWILGIWLCLSPWVLFFSDEPTATQNAVVLGAVIIFVEVVTLSVFRSWEEWVNVVLGAWLVISPWALATKAFAATADFVIVGLLVAALALYEIWDGRQNPPQQA